LSTSISSNLHAQVHPPHLLNSFDKFGCSPHNIPFTLHTLASNLYSNSN